jgi:hypothetical protein
MRRARGHRLQQVLGDQRVHCGHPGDVDDRDRGSRVHDLLEEALHHHLGARAVESADEGDGEDPVPELHHGSGELDELFLLPADDPLARLQVGLHRHEPELVEDDRDPP